MGPRRDDLSVDGRGMVTARRGAGGYGTEGAARGCRGGGANATMLCCRCDTKNPHVSGQ